MKRTYIRKSHLPGLTVLVAGGHRVAARTIHGVAADARLGAGAIQAGSVVDDAQLGACSGEEDQEEAGLTGQPAHHDFSWAAQSSTRRS